MRWTTPSGYADSCTCRAWGSARRGTRPTTSKPTGASERARREELGHRDRTADEEREFRTLCRAPDFADRERALLFAAREAAAPFRTNYACDAALSAAAEQWDEPELVDACRALTVPVLLVHGAADPRPSRAIESLATALPDAEVHVPPGAGHLPWVEAPDALESVSTAFLQRIDRES
jgi:proline iminopeptidase